MAAESRLQAAFRRLEAQRVEIERQVVADLELSLMTDRAAIVEMTTSHPTPFAPVPLDTQNTHTSTNCHVTTTWFEAWTGC